MSTLIPVLLLDRLNQSPREKGIEEKESKQCRMEKYEPCTRQTICLLREAKKTKTRTVAVQALGSRCQVALFEA